MLNTFFQPENILLDDNLNVKVSDFGFATVLGADEELTGKIPIKIKHKKKKFQIKKTPIFFAWNTRP